MKKKIKKLPILFFLIIASILLLTYFIFSKKNIFTSDTTSPNINLKNINNSNPTANYQIVDEIQISGWIPSWREKEALDTLNILNKGQMNEILPVWYKLNSDGGLDFQFGDYKKEIIELANKKNIDILPTINNITDKGFDSRIDSKMLDNQDEIIDAIISELNRNEYVGIDLDLEEIVKEDKDRFIDFIVILKDKLDKNDKKLSVTLHAQDGKSKWVGVQGQDIESIARYADEIRIMAYDFHGVSTPSGPITPKENLTSVIDYTLSKVDVEKVIICLPTYAYEWSSSSVVPMQYFTVKEIINNFLPDLKRDSNSGEVTFTYTKDDKKHTVWYQDYISMQTKIDLVKAKGINRVCFWNIGGEDLRFWTR